MMMTTQDMMTCGSSEELEKLPPDYKAPALEKGLDIIELLAGANKPMTLARISAKLNKSAAELFRMVRVLERREYIELPKGQTGYVLTDKLAHFGMARGDSTRLPECNLPTMRTIRELEEENTKLRYAVAELLIDNGGMSDFRSRKC